MDKSAALRAATLLRDFTDVGLRIIADFGVERAVGRGTLAFRAGDPSDTLSFIARGTLQLGPRDGGSAVGEVTAGASLGEVTAGDAVGGLALLVDGEHVLSALAMDDVELVELTKSAFEEMKKTHPR